MTCSLSVVVHAELYLVFPRIMIRMCSIVVFCVGVVGVLPRITWLVVCTHYRLRAFPPYR